MHCSRRYGAALAAGMLWTAGSALGVVIPGGSLAAPTPATPGDGLNGSVRFQSVNSLAAADNAIATLPSDATFHATSIDYPHGSAAVVSGGTLGDFLGADAASLSVDPAARGAFSNIFVFSGYLAVDQIGDVTFGVGSDDGFRLRIGGVAVAEFGNDRGFGFTTGLATFEAAGLYAVELIYYANSVGESGVQFVSSLTGGASYGNEPAGTIGLVPTTRLYTVPSPGAAMLFCMAAAFIFRFRRGPS